MDRIQPGFRKSVAHFFEDVWDQEYSPFCCCFVGAQIMTIIYRQLDHNNIIISPFELINHQCFTIEKVEECLVKGVSRLTKRQNIRMPDMEPGDISSKTYKIDGIRTYEKHKDFAQALLENFSRDDIVYPVIALGHWHNMDSNLAKAATITRPLIRKQKPKQLGYHAILITGIHVLTVKPLNIVAEIKNSHGVEWGNNGYSWASLRIFTKIGIPYLNEIVKKERGSSSQEIVKAPSRLKAVSQQIIGAGAERKYVWVERCLRTNEDIWQFQFRGIISSCLEPHLMVYVEFEEKTLMDNLEKLVQEETWDMDDGSQTSILSGSNSMQVCLVITRSTKRCSALTKNQTLLNLFKVFQKEVLKAYATKLFMKLPKGGTGIVASGMDGHIKTSDKDERMIWCYIVNTAETAQELSKMIDTQLADAVDMPQVHAELSAVTTKALVTLVSGLETQFDTEMAAMTRVPWATLQSVGDQSDRYVTNIKMILNGSIPELGSRLCPDYFQFCLDKLESSCFYLNIFKCKQISESGPQQMLLDTQAVKTLLLDISSPGKQTSGAASYSKLVSREMSKLAEALLKAGYSVPGGRQIHIPEGTPSDFQRILELKGLKKADQQTILGDFNNEDLGV